MKTTKKAKRIIAFAAALSLSACMMAMPAGTAFAAGNTITINDSSDGYTHAGYVAYQVFTGTYDSAANSGKGELTITGWGDGIKVDDFITALKGSNDFGATNPFNSVTNNAAGAQAVAEAISNFTDDSSEANAFAKLALKYADTNAKKTATKTDTSFSISDLNDGYYVVADSAAATSGDRKGFVLGMLVAGGNKTVDTSTKIDYPKVEKKVEENAKSVTAKPTYEANDYTGKLNDVADYNIGDSVPFKLYGTMPSNIDDYKAYYYKFTDTLADGLTVPDASDIHVEIDGIQVAAGKNMRIKVIGQQIAVSFEDIKSMSVSITKSSVVTVKYSAKLNNKATIGLSGNENTVHLSYLNNPNVAYTPNTTDDTEDRPNFPKDEGHPNNKDQNPYNDEYVKPDNKDNPDYPGNPSEDDKPATPGVPGPDTPETSDNPFIPGTPDDNISWTPEDKVIVFTYELDVTKIDASTSAKLQGAKFKLAKGDITTDNSTIQYATIASDTKAITWSDDGTVLESNENGIISIKGLDDGTYTLVETAQPTGYNAPGNNNKLVFKIDAATANNQAWDGTANKALTALKVTKTGGTLLNSLDDISGDSKTKNGDMNTGVVAFDVKNTQGATLPSTGGMGTTVFLLTGGTVAGAAAILYITKKRTSAEAK